MIDLNAEIRGVMDALERAEIEFRLAGSLASTLERGAGVGSSMDVLVWPDELDRALDVVDTLGFVRASRLLPLQAGRYKLQRLAKIDEIDILHLNLLASASRVDAALRDNSFVANEKRRADAFLELKLTFADHSTWRESDLWRRYEEIALAPESATPDDTEALLVGWRRLCQHGRTRELVRVAERLPAGLVGQDIGLTAYLDAARATVRSGRGQPRCMFRYTPAGFEWA